MKAKIRQLKKIQNVRKRVRDVAAAAAHAADARWVEAEEAKRQAVDTLEQFLDEASARMQRARTIDALLLMEDERHFQVLGIAQCETERKAAEAVSVERRNEMRARERDLRITEKMLDRARNEMARQIDKHEQKLADDLSSTRMRRMDE